MTDLKRIYQAFDHSSAEDASKRGIRDWTPRHREDTARSIQLATRYSRFVDFMKLFLPLSAGGLILVAIMSTFLQEDDDTTIKFEIIGTIEEDLQMSNPTMTGYDAEGRPFNVEAEKGIQFPDDPNRMDFEKITGQLNIPEDGSTSNNPLGSDKINLRADKGRMKSEENTMILTGDVTLTSEDNYEFRTERARIHFKDSSVTGPTTINGRSKMGTIVADSFKVKDNGNHIFFIGNVKTYIDPKKQNTMTNAEEIPNTQSNSEAGTAEPDKPSISVN